MASVGKHSRGYRAQVYVGGRRGSKVFRTLREANAWAAQMEEQIDARLAALNGVARRLYDHWVEGLQG